MANEDTAGPQKIESTSPRWDGTKVFNIAISLIGTSLAVLSFILSLHTSSEQEKLRRQINHDIVYALISYYQTINDFHSFVGHCFFDEQIPIKAQTVSDFYKNRLDELLKIHSTPEYHLFLKALQTVAGAKKIDAKDIEEIGKVLRRNNKVLGGNNEGLLNSFAGEDISHVISELELNTWWSTMDVFRRVSDLASYNGIYPNSLFQGEDARALESKHDKESMLVIKAIFNFETRTKVMFYFLTNYEQDITQYVASVRS